jgi:hypothetical protein
VEVNEPLASIFVSASWNSPLKLPPGVHPSEVATVTSWMRVRSGETYNRSA